MPGRRGVIPPSRGEARSSPRSAHQSGHFPSPWKMSEMQRAVGTGRAKHFSQSCPLLLLGHHRAEAKPGPPHVVRIGTDTFLCPEKCPGRRVRWGWAGRSVFAKLPFPLSGRRGVRAVLREMGRVPVRRHTLGFGHFALRPKCSPPGALRGGSAASGSAFIVRRAGRNRPERRPALLAF